MIIINSVSNTLFSFNGIEYFRNYISVVRGERIEIFNCYERDDVMLPLTHYSEVSLNGITYSNASDLQSTLQTVVYSRATLGSDEVEVVEQNNVGKIIYLDYVNGSDLLTQVLGDINSQTTLISATDNPVFFTAYKSASTASVAQKLRFQFMGGKGTWGAGGSAVLPSHLYQLPPESLLPEDITANSKSNVISLGQVTNEAEFLTKVNSAVRDLTDTSKLHYFSYSLDSVLYLKRFTGQPGEYDGTQTVLTETDFNDATNSNVQPGLYLPTLKDITAVDSFTDSPITITDNNTGDNITFSGSSIKHTSANGDTTTLDYQPNTEDVTYSIPAKSTNDVFAMQSDVNGITIVSNQSASELYLKNVDGTILATINLGFLNNEGTTFFYNETSEKLELKNDDDEVLSEIPVSAFVANLMQSVNFNGSIPQTLEFKDAEGNVVDSVSFSISNIQGLQALLDAKVSYADMDSVPTSGSNNAVKSGGIYDMIRKYVVSTETDLDNYNEAGYFLTPSSGVLNLPNGFSQTRYTLTVNAANLNYGSQILVSCGGDGAIAIRRKSNTWGAWSVIALDSNVVKTIGDQTSINGTKGWIARQIYNGVITKPFPDIRRHKYLASYSSNAAAVSGGIRVAIPMVVSSMWTMKLKVIEYSAAFPSNSNAVSYFEISGYGTNLVANKSVWCSNPNNYTQVRHGRNNADNKTVIFIDKSTAFAYPKVIIENIDFYYSGYDGNDYYDTTKYECYITTDESDFVQNSIITNSQFIRDSFYWNKSDFNVDNSIGDAQDLNNYTKTGNYSQTLNAQAASGSNYPEPVSGMLEVYSNNVVSSGGVRVYQKYHTYTNTVYIRTNNAGKWFGWVKVWDNGDFSQLNIDNWNTAFGWGDFRQYGLGATAKISNNWDTINQTGFYYNDSASATGTPLNVANISLQHIEQAVSAIQIAFRSGGDGIWFRRRVTTAWSTWANIWTSQEFTQSNINNWNNALLKSGGTMTGAIKYGNSILNQTSFIGTQIANTNTGYSAWMLQNLDYDSINDKFTKPRGSLTSRALAIGTGEKALRFMTAPTSTSNGDDADLNTVFSVDITGKIETENNGNSEQWNQVYSDKNNYLRNQADGTVGNYLGGTSITNLNNLITGMVWTSGSVLNLPSAVSYLVFSLSGSNGYSAQLAMRNTNFFFRANENGTWGSWKRIWHAGDFSQTNIDNWDASWNNKKIDAIYVNGGDGTDANIEFSGAGGHKFSYGSGTWLANRAWSAYGGLITFKRNDINAHGLQFQYDVGHLNPTGGRLAFRTAGDTIKPWKTIWNDGDFSQLNIDNWNTAFGRGDFRQFGLGTNIIVSSDWDSINQSGFYKNENTSTVGIPIAVSSISMIHMEVNSNATQIAFRSGGSDYYIRRRNLGVWSDWDKIWTNQNLTTDSIAQWDEAYTHSDSSGNPHNTQVDDIPGLQDELNSKASASDVTAIKRPYRSYTAIVTQTGTNIPIPMVVLENDLGFEPQWSYATVGVYNINQENGFDRNKTWVNIQVGLPRALGDINEFRALVDASNDLVQISTSKYNATSGAVLTDGLLNRAFIEIRVYD
ncbi:pyocin knob domain-containing protein [Flavobacterium sp. C4GT6]|uniref:pyocin knob domain-containing protein n=1 Tax=Flavobacterium sp. C4GT6 TaxID=3103818 RepID=UPI002ED15509